MNTKLNAGQLRKWDGSQEMPEIAKQEIYIVLDNILDTYNIGSIFRLADAVAARKVYLCGATATPPNHRIQKASINTTEWVDWEYRGTAVEVIEELRKEVPGVKVIAIEQAENSVSYDEVDYSLPIALVVGHETTGIAPETLKHCDVIAEMPMYGVNISLNVMVSLAIVLYRAIGKKGG